MSGLALDGLRVIDLTTIVFGPYTTQILGDFGADVIKVEAPGGDVTRAIGPGKHPGMSALFLGSNRNKRSIVLDLKREAARDALWRLIDSADLFVHNMRAQKIAALGFDPPSVLARRPSLVYGALLGYRDGGPYSGRPAYDDVIQGESGLAGTFYARDGEPELIPTVAADKNAALMAAAGLLAGIIRKLRSGKGTYVEVSMFEGLVGYTLVEHQAGMSYLPALGEPGYARALSSERRPHRTADGYLCLLAYTDRQWQRFWALAGRQELAEDRRFSSITERSRHTDALYRLAGEVLTTRTTRAWLDALTRAEIPCGPVSRLEDLPNNPQLAALGFFREYEHPSEGRLAVPDTAYRFDGASLPIRQAHPRLGEHGEQLLAELGLSAREIATALATEPSG